MIGKISIGKSFRGCLNYCLENKPEQIANSLGPRAEILDYNFCFGDKKELIQQFNDGRALNSHLSKPVLHITLSFAPGERIPKHHLFDMIEECALKMGFENNQFVAIEHNDTMYQHIHIVANRVGRDGKTVKDSHNYRRIAEYCRQMEKKYNLERVLSPRKFLSDDQREVPRINLRKENLRSRISTCLVNSKDFSGFEKLIRLEGYDVIKARGIAFVDKNKVKFKGSEVGYPLKRIEHLLSLAPGVRKDIIVYKEKKHREQQSEHVNEKKRTELTEQNLKTKESRSMENRYLDSRSHVLESLLKPERDNGALDQNLIQKKKKRRSPGL